KQHRLFMHQMSELRLTISYLRPAFTTCCRKNCLTNANRGQKSFIKYPLRCSPTYEIKSAQCRTVSPSRRNRYAPSPTKLPQKVRRTSVDREEADDRTSSGG